MAEQIRTIGLSRESIIHPGEILSEVLEDRGINQRELALRTGVSEKHISTVIHGQKGISARFARKLDYALDIDAEFWMNLQADYDRCILEYEELHDLSKEEINILTDLKKVIRLWKRLGVLDDTEDTASIVLDLRKIFKVNNLLDIPKINKTCFKINRDSKTNPYILNAWLRTCELLTEDFESAGQVDYEKLKEKIPAIKRVMYLREDQIQTKLSEIFLECGVIFKIVPGFDELPVKSFLKSTKNDSTILCISSDVNFKDSFWLTLFSGLLRLIKNKEQYQFVELDREDTVDELVWDFLIDPVDYKKFIKSENYKESNDIEKFADSQNVQSFIVRERLVQDKFLQSEEKPVYEWQFKFEI